MRLTLLNGKVMPFISATLFLTVIALILESYSGGPAKSGETVTGAPFNSNETCSKCHGGGDFGGGITLQLLDASNNPVTAYTPGALYTFQISMTHSVNPGGYGFQTTVASTGDVNYDNWGALPAHTHNKLVSGRNYVEQSEPLSTGTISIPWTAPLGGSGSMVFYTAGDLVDGDFNPLGDQPVNTSLTITESALPVTMLYFKGVIQGGAAMLSWATAQETNNKEFVIEKSADQKSFSPVAVVSSAGDNRGHTYSWRDASFHNTAYYRLKQVDFDGHSTFFNIVDLKTPNASYYDLTFYAHAGTNSILFYNGVKQQRVVISCYDMSGRRLCLYNTTAVEGNNMYPLPVSANGIIIVKIASEDGIITSKKFALMKQ